MLKFKILDTLIKGVFRVFKGETFKDIIYYSKQYNSGGDDYNPADNVECLSNNINNNNTDTIVYLYNDNTVRISCKGEKRIYSTDELNSEIKASIYLKNNGNIEINAKSNINIIANSDLTINSANKLFVNANNIKATAGTIDINGAVNILGDTTITGGLVVSGVITGSDCISGAISGLNHTHGGVMIGTGITGKAQ